MKLHAGVAIAAGRAGLLALFFSCSAVPARAQPLAPQQCAALRNLELPGAAISEVTAEWMPAGPAPGSGASAVTLPAYCRVQATLDRRTGVNGQYGIGFALALPAD